MPKSSGYNICSVDGSTLYKSENKEFKDFKFTLLDPENSCGAPSSPSAFLCDVVGFHRKESPF